jgi:hypothetical protein
MGLENDQRQSFRDAAQRRARRTQVYCRPKQQTIRPANEHSAPDFAGDLDDEGELGPLRLLGQRIAFLAEYGSQAYDARRSLDELRIGNMIKTAYFASRDIKGWPQPEDIKHYFLAPPEQRWFFNTGNDTAGFVAEGLDGTEHFPREKRARVTLSLSAHPRFGVMLDWSKWDGRQKSSYVSKGDTTRLRQLVLNLHDDPLPVGLLVSYDAAWEAVKEFLETDGQLPKSIEWLSDDELPPDIFLDQGDPIVEERLIERRR